MAPEGTLVQMSDRTETVARPCRTGPLLTEAATVTGLPSVPEPGPTTWTGSVRPSRSVACRRGRRDAPGIGIPPGFIRYPA